ncbi:MAG: DUF3018 domain-containing protein [Chelatococcus sp.]|nr:MAG: DUF3018 domain-containing protein [Chelatococcus sp.]
MPRPAIKDGLTKQARYRAARKAAGLKQIRLWVYDTENPEFRERLRREMEAVRASEQERRDIAFVESVTDWPPEE